MRDTAVSAISSYSSYYAGALIGGGGRGVREPPLKSSESVENYIVSYLRVAEPKLLLSKMSARKPFFNKKRASLFKGTKLNPSPQCLAKSQMG